MAKMMITGISGMNSIRANMSRILPIIMPLSSVLKTAKMPKLTGRVRIKMMGNISLKVSLPPIRSLKL